MKYSIAALMLSVGAQFSVFADVLKLKSDAPQQYEVKEGDTLWDISTLYLSAPWRWPELWQWNQQIDDPDLIYPGNVLLLEYDEQGRPRLVLKKGVRKLSPRTRVVLQKTAAIPTLPLAMIEPFLRYDQAIAKDELSGKPTIIGSTNNYLRNIQGQILYVKGDLNQSANYGIYRRGDAYIDPENGDTLAYESRLVGTARVLSGGDIEAGQPARVEIETVRQEVKKGDVLLPINLNQSFPAQFGMARPDKPITGAIISSDEHVREFGALSIVVLNKGSQDNLKEGHILDINKQSPSVIETKNGPRYVADANKLDKFMSELRETFGTENDEDSVVWTMPKEKVGELMVFKVYDNISYAMITRSNKSIRVGDNVSAR